MKRLMILSILALFTMSLFFVQSVNASPLTSFEENPIPYWEDNSQDVGVSWDSTEQSIEFVSEPSIWLIGWNYRILVNITGSVGAETDYQVSIIIPYDANMQTDFDDIVFTDNDMITPLDFWREYYTVSTTAKFWVEVQDSLDSDSNIFMYYGNDTVSTTSSGANTFQAFFDKDSTSGWTVSNAIEVSTSGDFLRLYNPTAGEAGEVQRWDITTSADFQMMARYKTVSIGASDQGVIILGDASTADRFSYSFTPYSGTQTEWQYHDGARKAGGAWTEGTEFIFTHQIDEGDSTNGIDFRRYDTSWSLLDSKLSENFAAGSPVDCDGIYMGDASGAATIDMYIRWLVFRKCIDIEPIFASFGDEEVFTGTLDVYVPVTPQSIQSIELMGNFSALDSTVRFQMYDNITASDLFCDVNSTQVTFPNDAYAQFTDVARINFSLNEEIRIFRIYVYAQNMTLINYYSDYAGLANKDYMRMSDSEFEGSYQLLYLQGDVGYLEAVEDVTNIFYQLFLSTELYGYFGPLALVVIGFFITKKEKNLGIFMIIVDSLVIATYLSLIEATPDYWWHVIILLLGVVQCTIQLMSR